MVYISKRRGFRDFIKNRNNIFYIAIILAFLVLFAVAIVIARTKNIFSNDNETTAVEDETNQEESSGDYVDSTGIYKILIYPNDYVLQIFAYDSTNQTFSETPLKTMICAINEDSLLSGTEDSLLSGNDESDNLSVNSRVIWESFDEEFWRYAVHFSSDLVFHSALYTKQSDRNSLDVDSYNSLGEASEIPGITLMLADAKWIYENCSFDSVISISEDSISEDITYSSVKVDIPDGVYYDPSEVSDESPWCPYEIATFDCPSIMNFKIHTTEESIIKKIKVLDSNNNDLSEYLQLRFIGKYNLNKPGVMTCEAYIVDSLGNYYSQEITINIVSDEEESTSKIDESSVAEQTSAKEATEASTESNTTCEDESTSEESQTTVIPADTSNEQGSNESSNEENITVDSNGNDVDKDADQNVAEQNAAEQNGALNSENLDRNEPEL